MTLAVLPSAGWASCLWVDMRRMDPPNPGRDGLVVAANQCLRDMSFAFGEWNPKTGKVDTWSEDLSANGDAGNYRYVGVKLDYVLVATPCQSDCKVEQAYFRARRTFNPTQSVIWMPPTWAPPDPAP